MKIYTNKFVLSLLLLFGGLSLNAQILSIDPVFPTVDDTVTILYDASMGNGELVGVSPVYAHAGVITSNSTSPTDWQYVQGNWGTPDPNTLMTDLGGNIHEIKYHMRSYYGIPMNETVLEMAFVFRNADGSKVGRDTDGSDIYYPVYAGGTLELAFLSPDNGLVYETGDPVSVKMATSDSSDIDLLLNGSVVAQGFDKSLEYNFNAGAPGTYWLKMVADNGTTVKEDSVYFLVRGPVNVQDPAAGIVPGINYINDTTVVLALEAPGKDYVYVMGGFSDWLLRSEYYMNQSTDGELWWVEISGLTPMEEYAYQYLVDGNIKIGDPYCDKVLDPWNDPWIPSDVYPNLKPYPTGLATEVVSVFQTAQTPYQWQDAGYVRPDQKELIVYELLIRDFVANHDYKTVIDSLDYLSRLGVNAIELLPIMEFEGNSSWGYNPSYLFAVDKYYGTRYDLKAFIDSCHNRGIAVILDMVVNHHFGQSPLVRLYWDAASNRPAADNPWFNQDATHPFNVGYDMNHESDYTKRYVDRILKYWVEEYHFDGYRMDLSKGFTQTNNPNDVGAWGQYDASRVALLKRMADELWSVDPGTYFILEHFADNSEEQELIEYGMMVWSNHVHNYNEGTMGYVGGSNFDWINYKNRGFSVPHNMAYMESHDEERLMYKNLTFGNSNGSYSTKDLNTGLARVEMAAAFFIPVPGPKMIWQFGELGYDVSIDFNGRTGEKPIRWEYYQNQNRRQLYNVFAALNHLKQDYDVFKTDDFSLNANGAFKRLQLNDPSMNVTIIGNFDVSSTSGNPMFQHAGMWYDYFSGDSINVTDVNASMTLAAGEYHIYLDQKLEQPLITDIEEVYPEAVNQFAVFPNPFQEATFIQFDLAERANVSIEVWDLTGRLVRRLAIPAELGPGSHQFQWDGFNQAGQQVSNGTYMLRMRVNQQSITKTILFMN